MCNRIRWAKLALGWERERERERDRQTDRQTDRLTDRQTDRQIETERGREILLCDNKLSCLGGGNECRKQTDEL